MFSRICAVVCSAALVAAGEPGAGRLKKDVKFLASDKLKGRAAGTPELERAGEYIALRFWKLGLQPGTAGGWFQAVPVRSSSPEVLDVRINAGGQQFTITRDNTVALSAVSVELASAPVIKVDRAYLRSSKPDSLAGKLLVTTEFGARIPARSGRPLAIVLGEPGIASRIPGSPPSLQFVGRSNSPATLASTDEALAKWINSLSTGDIQGATATGKITAVEREYDLHNVIGVLRGSDPNLRDTYVIVSAHYDHLGEFGTGEDRIRNGANDDASGTATMMAVAEAISKIKRRPKRSIIFAGWTGEEEGGLGSRFYAHHPLFPLNKTIANINIEQDGRYDGEGGAGPKRLYVTGFSYSDVGKVAAEAAKPTGVEVYAAPNEFFERSDNLFLAFEGVPAHTMGSALEFPDYHKVSDSADKLDYENLALLTKAITAAVVAMANSEQAPEWNASERATTPYRKARSASLGH